MIRDRCAGCGGAFITQVLKLHQTACLRGMREARAVKPWGCPRCSSRSGGRVTDTGYDESGYPVRQRTCACGFRWATEETPIAPTAFYPRTYVWDGTRYRRRRRTPEGAGPEADPARDKETGSD